jgi:hypothetical protein
MSTPITNFEIVESIRFFASLVGTAGVEDKSVKLANKYIHRLLESLDKSVEETVAANSNIQIVRGKS